LRKSLDVTPATPLPDANLSRGKSKLIKNHHKKRRKNPKIFFLELKWTPRCAQTFLDLSKTTIKNQRASLSALFLYHPHS